MIAKPPKTVTCPQCKTPCEVFRTDPPAKFVICPVCSLSVPIGMSEQLSPPVSPPAVSSPVPLPEAKPIKRPDDNRRYSPPPYKLSTLNIFGIALMAIGGAGMLVTSTVHGENWAQLLGKMQSTICLAAAAIVGAIMLSTTRPKD